MMTQDSSRKRSRCQNEDETEFMPLSKRINNLHINNNMSVPLDSTNLLPHSTNLLPQPSHQAVGWGLGPPTVVPQIMPESPAESVRNLEWNNNNGTNPQYNPELSETENPYYFTINKLLYEMYLARQQRNANNSSY